jgi:MFS family permease
MLANRRRRVDTGTMSVTADAPGPGQPGEGTAAPIGQVRVRAVFAGLMLALLLAALDQTIVATALPTIVGDLGGLDHISWVTTAYLLASTTSTPVYGKLGDLYGRKRVFQVAIVIFLIGSALCGLSESMLELILFRALQGLGGGGLIVGAQAIIGDVVSPRDRGRYQGIFGAVFAVASVAGPLLGGFFVENLSWRWIFYVNLPIGAIALVVIAIVLPASAARRSHRIDWLGTLLLTAGVSCLILFLSLGGSTQPWGRSSCWSSDERRSRSCRCTCSPTASSRSPARSVSSSVSACSARSRSCRCSCRSSTARARPARAWSSCR